MTQNHFRTVKDVHEVQSQQRLAAESQVAPRLQAVVPEQEAPGWLRRKQAAAPIRICQLSWS